MSGGVDSAVTLLRAAPNAIGVTLRLWQDPAGPRPSARAARPRRWPWLARDVSRARAPARDARSARGVRAAVVDPFVTGYAAGDTPNPCTRCNGAFRFDALLAFAERAGAETLWTGHYARIVERDGDAPRRSARPTRKGPVLHALDARSGRARADPVSARRADEGRNARGGGPRRACRRPTGPRAKRPASSPATTIGGSLSVAASPRRGPDRRRGAASSSVATRASGASRRVSGGDSASRRRARCTCSVPTARRTPSSWGRESRSPRRRSRRRVGIYVPVEQALVKLRYRSHAVPARVSVPQRRLLARARGARLRGRDGSGRGAVQRRPRCRRGRRHPRRVSDHLGSWPMGSWLRPRATSSTTPSRSSSSRPGSGSRTCSCGSAARSGASPRSSGAPSRSSCRCSRRRAEPSTASTTSSTSSTS